MTCAHEEELIWLRAAITRHREFDPSLQLWKGEARILAILYKRPGVTTEVISSVLSGSPNKNTDSVRVQISRLRKKLPPGVTIQCIGGFYCLTGKDIIKEYIVRI